MVILLITYLIFKSSSFWVYYESETALAVEKKDAGFFGNIAN
jgi:hypothetical protein